MTRQDGLSYRVLLTKEMEGGYTVTIPTLPGCVTYGDTVAEAISMARGAIDLYLESLEAQSEPIPDERATLEYTLTVSSHA